MAEETIADAAPAAVRETNDKDASKENHTNVPTRSWRKKYRKLRQRFSRVMSASNTLTRDEYKAQALARRLQEEVDQLQELLLHLRQTGDLTLPTSAIGQEIQDSLAGLRSGEDVVGEVYLKELLKMPHKTYNFEDIPDHILEATASNNFDTAYADEYLANLDAQLEDETFFDDLHRTLRPPRSRTLPSDKELMLQNSDSVISWLRRNHPETFIQDKDHEKEKPEPKKRGGGKRQSQAQAPAPKVEPTEEGEEEMAYLDVPEKPEKPARGKKTKDDDAYRPKGGSSRGKKRKRAEEGEEKKSGKKTKAVVS